MTGLDVSPDGATVLSTGKDGTMRHWDLATGAERRKFAVPGNLARFGLARFGLARFAPGGARGLYTVHADPEFSGGVLYDLSDGAEINRYPMDQTWSNWGGFSADGGTLLVIGMGDAVGVWDVSTATVRQWLRNPDGWVTSAALAADGKTAVTANQRSRVARVWDADTGAERFALGGHPTGVGAVAVSADGRLAATAGEDGVVRVWDLGRRAVRATLAGHTDRVTGLAFDPAGGRLVSASRDATARVWALDPPGEAACFRGHAGAVAAVALHPDGRRLLTGGDDGTVRVWAVP